MGCIIEFIFEVLIEGLFFNIIGRTGAVIRNLFRFKIIVDDEMDELGKGCLDYIIGILFYVLVFYLIITIFR